MFKSGMKALTYPTMQQAHQSLAQEVLGLLQQLMHSPTMMFPVEGAAGSQGQHSAEQASSPLRRAMPPAQIRQSTTNSATALETQATTTSAATAISSSHHQPNYLAHFATSPGSTLGSSDDEGEEIEGSELNGQAAEAAGRKRGRGKTTLPPFTMSSKRARM